MKKLIICAALSVSAFIATTQSAYAEYPTAPVQFVVPWPPGDFEDILTRMIAKNMQESTGVSASVVNKPGGGDGPFPGALEVLAAPNDGSMIGSFGLSVPISGPFIDIGIDEDSFMPVGIFLTSPFVLAASGDVPYSNMAELAAHAQDNDDDAAFDLLDCNTLSSGDADVINTTLALIEPCLSELNILANIGSEPIAKLPGVETLSSQAGINDLELWNGLFVTKGTPQEVIDTLAKVASETMASDEAQALMNETGARVYWQNAEESAARILADREKSNELKAIIAE